MRIATYYVVWRLDRFMTMRKGWTVCLLIALFCLGCATNPPETTTASLASKYPDWSGETIEKVQHGVIELGMTKAQVMEALKQREAYEVTKMDEKWTYLDDRRLGLQENRTDRVNILTFKNDRLVKFDTTVRISPKGW